MRHAEDTNSAAGKAISPEAFSSIVRRCYGQIYLVAYSVVRDRDTADDIAQETLLRAWLKLDSLRDHSLVDAWLARIARTTAWRWQRSGRSRSRLLPLISLEEVVVEPMDKHARNPRDAAQHKEMQERLHEAVMSLPDDLRETVLLHYAEGLSISSLARLSGEAPSTVSRRLNRAHKQLRGLLEPGEMFASLRATAASTAKAQAIIAGAAALPAAVQAQLQQLASDTPPPPSSIADLTAPTGGAHSEATMFKGLGAQLGFMKIAAGVLVAGAVIAGGSYIVDSVAGNKPGPSERSQQDERRFATDSPGGEVKVRSLRSRSNGKLEVGSRSRGRDPLETVGSKRLSPAERTAALRSDLVSTHPVVIAESETTSASIQFDLQVVDESGMPVKGASVTLPGFQTRLGEFEPRVELPLDLLTTFTTNDRGIARVLLTNSFGNTELIGVTARASHPQYATTAATMRLTSVTKLVMEKGRRVEIVPVDRTTSEPVRTGVIPAIFATFQPEWTQGPDGTILVEKLTEDTLDFQLRHTRPDGKMAVSQRQQIPIPSPGNEPVKVELHPTFTLRARLSEVVPRPVVDMDLRYAYLPSGENVNAEMNYLKIEEGTVEPDGTFTIPNIPPDTPVYISAINRDYCSLPVNTARGRCAAQKFVLSDADLDVELPMVPTGAVALKLVDADGEPIVGADISCATNVGYGQRALTWGMPDLRSAQTGEDGIAVLTGLPPIDAGVEVRFSKFRTLTDRPVHEAVVPLSPGQKAELTVPVEPVPTVDETPSQQIRVPDGATITYEMPPSRQ